MKRIVAPIVEQLTSSKMDLIHIVVRNAGEVSMSGDFNSERNGGSVNGNPFETRYCCSLSQT